MSRPSARLTLSTIVLSASCSPGAQQPRALMPTKSVPTAEKATSPEPPSTTSDEAMSPLRIAIDRAAGYLIEACRPDGQFVYRINLDPRVPTAAARYNVLRHAGAMYSMATYQARWPTEAMAEALSRAALHLEQHLGPIPDAPDTIAVWSSSAQREGKLGGTGLGLVAFEQTRRATGARIPPLAPLGRFVRRMQKDDGSFFSKYLVDEGGPSDRWTSLYYPGEAALGMLMLQGAEPAEDWGQVAHKALLYLARSRRGRSRVPRDHWALIATKVALRREGLLSTQEREELVQHSRQIVEAILAARALHPPSSKLHGCFTRHGRTTPTATQLEGLLAALEHVTDPALRLRMRAAIDPGIAFLMRAMTTELPYVGAIPRAIEPRSDQPSSSRFNRRAGEVRIDYVQHALSAFIAFHELDEWAADHRTEP